MNGSSVNSSGGLLYTQLTDYKVGAALDKYGHIVIVIMALLGNTAALVTITRMKPIRSATISVAILAVFDSLAVVSKFLYTKLTYNSVPLGDFGCQLLNFFASYFVDFANWVVVLMTIERFVAVWFPLKVSRIITRRRSVYGYVLLAVVLLPTSLCTFWIYEQIDYPGYGTICYQKSSMAKLLEVWDKIEFCIYAAIPCTSLIILNSLLVYGIQRFSSTQRQTIGSAEQQKARKNTEKQLTRMLVSASVTFLILVIPIGVFYVVRPHWNYRQSEYSKARYYLTRSLVHLLADLNHGVNFCIYFLSGAKFRRTFLKLFHCKARTATGSTIHSTRYDKSSTASTAVTADHDSKVNEMHKF